MLPPGPGAAKWVGSRQLYQCPCELGFGAGASKVPRELSKEWSVETITLWLQRRLSLKMVTARRLGLCEPPPATLPRVREIEKHSHVARGKKWRAQAPSERAVPVVSVACQPTKTRGGGADERARPGA